MNRTEAEKIKTEVDKLNKKIDKIIEKVAKEMFGDKRKHFYVPDLEKVHYCPNCINGDLGYFGDFKSCDKCNTLIHEGTDPEGKEQVKFD